MAETFLTVAQVADELQVTAQTIRNWIDQGVLPAVRVGRAFRIRREDVDDLLDRARAESESLAARRDNWKPQLWRLPRGHSGVARGASVWDEDTPGELVRPRRN
jgi:excisionase family DNA binding protein